MGEEKRERHKVIESWAPGWWPPSWWSTARRLLFPAHGVYPALVVATGVTIKVVTPKPAVATTFVVVVFEVPGLVGRSVTPPVGSSSPSPPTASASKSATRPTGPAGRA